MTSPEGSNQLLRRLKQGVLAVGMAANIEGTILPEARGAEPTETAPGPDAETLRLEVMEADKRQRAEEINRWIQDLEVPNLSLRRHQSKRSESAIVLLNNNEIGTVNCDGLEFKHEELLQKVRELLIAEKDTVFADPPETVPDTLVWEYLLMAEKVEFEDETTTRRLMSQWKVIFDGYTIRLGMDDRDNGHPITAKGGSLEKLTFSHTGEDTIIITTKIKNGNTQIFRITRGLDESLHPELFEKK